MISRQTKKPIPKGFTLVELMITVAIIGILASIAIPTYQNSVIASGRAEGKSILVQVAAEQERFYSSNNSFTTSALPFSTPPIPLRLSDNGLYLVAVQACAGGAIINCFIATATPQENQASDSCGNLTLTSTNVRGASGGTVDECWN